MDLSHMDAGSIITVAVCGIVLIAAVVRFIIHILSNRKDK